MFEKFWQLSDFVNISKEEKEKFLIKWGYELKTIKCWENVSVYHNDVETRESIKEVALKDKESYEIAKKGHEYYCRSLEINEVFDKELRERFTNFFIEKLA